MSEIIQASYLVDDNGQMLELVDQTARAGLVNTVKIVEQTLTNEEKVQVRANIGAIGVTTEKSKNLANVTWRLAKIDGTGNYIALSEASANGGNTATQEFIPVEPNMAYTMSCGSIGAPNITLYHQEHNKEKGHILYKAHTLAPGSPITFTTGENTAYIRVNAYREGCFWGDVAPKNFQIELGPVATPYVEPGEVAVPDDALLEAIKIAGLPDGSVALSKLGDDVVVVSKNLFRGTWEKAQYNSNGVFTPVAGAGHVSVRPETQVVGGRIYAISWGDVVASSDEASTLYMYLHQFGADGKRTKYQNFSFAKHYEIVTMEPNTVCIALMVWRQGNATTMEDIIPEWVQVEEGSKVTDYVGATIIRNELIDKKMLTEQVAPSAANMALDNVRLEQASSVVRTIAHRGDDIYAPQCTAPAYIVARKHGHNIMENDVMLTEDGQIVMWHDTTLSRLGNLVDINGYHMYTDGSVYYWVNPSTNAVYTYDTDYVASSVALSTLTRCVGSNYGANSTWGATGLNFDVLRRIDFGAWFDTKYAGTQVLTFEEWILLCKQLGSEVYIDSKLTYTDEIITEMANIVKKYGMGCCTSWLGIGDIAKINKLREIIPDARVGILTHPTASNVETYKTVNTGRGFFFNGDAKNGMTAEAIQLGLNAGYDVEVWYVDYGNATTDAVFEVIRNAVTCGVTAVTTDHYRVDEAFRYLLEQY